MSEDEHADDPALSAEHLDLFREQLENMIVAGHSITSMRRWAKSAYGVEADIMMRIKNEIERMWVLESQNSATVRRRRDDLRMKYFAIYEAAMAEGKFIPAVKALDGVAKLDGLVSPDIHMTQVNIDDKKSTTVDVRARILELTEKMKARSEKRVEQNEKIINMKLIGDAREGS